MKKLLDVITKQQFVVVIVSFIAVGVFTIINWATLDFLYKLACFMFFGLCLHQLEEYCFPGGFLWGLNTTMGSNNQARWPGDRLSAGLCDVIATTTGCYLTIFQLNPFIVGCFATVALIEVIVHIFMGIMMKKHFAKDGKNTIYVPGSATSWLIFAPLGIASIYILISENSLTLMNLGWATMITIAFLAVTVIGPVLLLQDKNSIYTYPKSMQKGYYKKFYS